MQELFLNLVKSKLETMENRFVITIQLPQNMLNANQLINVHNM